MSNAIASTNNPMSRLHFASPILSDPIVSTGRPVVDPAVIASFTIPARTVIADVTLAHKGAPRGSGVIVVSVIVS